MTWSPLAERQAEEAYEYIARDRPDAARKWLTELIDRVDGLHRFPRRGRVIPEIGRPDYRQILHHPYRVIYVVREGRVEVLAVRHLRRDWSTLSR
ncbi:MAG: type II toxin-antitoxin system RelE/ParE family toxin [Gemmatimonadaceae bacterium]|nr:type II toxin-antitoxin system RelE/ParE family toxin [Gemmatimonadaceae bacterium]